jgi:riboflavin kinase/FMN adenylyltransferase
MIKPPYGVYAVELKILDNVHYGIANFGMRPTFNKDSAILEAHIFDFDLDIYGSDIEVIFHSKIRDEIKFDGIKELLKQISLDITVAKQKLNYGN